MKYIDLHTHSTYSDGTDTPAQLVTRARAARLSAIALTDHDTVDGMGEAIKTGEALGVTVVPGIELSTEYDGTEIHVLGYFIDFENEPLLDALTRIRVEREARNRLMIDTLNRAGLTVTYDELLNTATGGTVTRGHMGSLLHKKRYASSIREAFDKYIGVGKPCYVEKQFIELFTCLSLIKKSGGVSSLAHPLQYEFSPKTLENLVSACVPHGLGGIETIYPTHAPADREALAALAKKYGLLLTGGSDYHGRNKPHIKLGTGMGNVSVEQNVLQALKRRAAMP